MEETFQPFALIIEDEPDLALIFAKALEMSGFHTTIYGNGLQALQALAVIIDIPALVILDFSLPQASGLEILRYIRDQEKFAHTRVIMATSDSAAVVGEIEKKADIVLLKPISFTQLREITARFR